MPWFKWAWSFAASSEQIGHTGPLTAWLAVQWAQQPQQCHLGYRGLRLNVVRRFAQFWKDYEPRTEIPDRNYFSQRYRRRPVHIYSPEEIGALLEASAEVGRIHPLRGSTFRVVVGLLCCTGLRVGEALGLCDQDIDWSRQLITIRNAKCGHSREVPLHLSTLEALQRYRTLRDKTLAAGRHPRLFVNFRGKPLGYFAINDVFRKLCQDLGWTLSPIPRLHDFRHTFAVRTLVGWYQTGEPIGPKLWTLSTYLGHRHLADTYWYLTAVPELMQLCQQRFASAQAWASQGGGHE